MNQRCFTSFTVRNSGKNDRFFGVMPESQVTDVSGGCWWGSVGVTGVVVCFGGWSLGDDDDDDDDCYHYYHYYYYYYYHYYY